MASSSSTNPVNITPEQSIPDEFEELPEVAHSRAARSDDEEYGIGAIKEDSNTRQDKHTQRLENTGVFMRRGNLLRPGFISSSGTNSTSPSEVMNNGTDANSQPHISEGGYLYRSITASATSGSHAPLATDAQHSTTSPSSDQAVTSLQPVCQAPRSAIQGTATPEHEASVTSPRNDIPANFKVSFAIMLSFQESFSSLQESVRLVRAREMMKATNCYGIMNDEVAVRRVIGILDGLAVLHRTT